MKGQRDPAIEQIMKQMTFMQNTMQTFMDNSNNAKVNKMVRENHHLRRWSTKKLANLGNNTAGPADAVPIGEIIVPARNLDTKKRHCSGIVWMAVTRTVYDFIEGQKKLKT